MLAGELLKLDYNKASLSRGPHEFVSSEDAPRRESENPKPQKTLSKYEELNGRGCNPEADPETLKVMYRDP